MKLRLPRYRCWWWLVILSTVLIGLVIGDVAIGILNAPAASGELVNWGMTYRQVNERLHKRGWSLRYTEGEAEYSTWQDAHGHRLWVEFDMNDRVVGHGMDTPASLIQRGWDWAASRFARLAGG
jgi:hypothetical protein